MSYSTARVIGATRDQTAKHVLSVQQGNTRTPRAPPSAPIAQLVSTRRRWGLTLRRHAKIVRQARTRATQVTAIRRISYMHTSLSTTDCGPHLCTLMPFDDTWMPFHDRLGRLQQLRRMSGKLSTADCMYSVTCSGCLNTVCIYSELDDITVSRVWSMPMSA